MEYIIPADQRAEFRALYLYSGNATKSARELNMNERTGRKLALEMSLEPDFIEDRRKLQVQYLDELIAMRMQVADEALERFKAKNEIPESVGEGSTVTIIDKRPDYGKLVLEAEKNAHGIAKLSNPLIEKSGGAEVSITISGPVTSTKVGASTLELDVK